MSDNEIISHKNIFARKDITVELLEKEFENK